MVIKERGRQKRQKKDKKQQFLAIFGLFFREISKNFHPLGEIIKRRVIIKGKRGYFFGKSVKLLPTIRHGRVLGSEG